MIKIIHGNDGMHNDHVANAVDELQRKGLNVTNIKRIKRAWPVIGESVTYIYYDNTGQK
jgi:hypothetical protein